METVVDFTSQVFAFIENTYGKGVIKKVKLKKHNEVIDRLIADALSREYDEVRTGNKIVAMLKVNP